MLPFMLVALIIASLGAITTASLSDTTVDTTTQNVRFNYVELKASTFQNGHFLAFLEIYLKVEKPTKEIVLLNPGLSIEMVYLFDGRSDEYFPVKFHSNEKDVIVVKSYKFLSVNNYKLQLKFSRYDTEKLSEKSMGLYTEFATHKRDTGKTYLMAEFGKRFPLSVFPRHEQVAQNATITVLVGHNHHQRVICNMPMTKDSLPTSDSSQKWTTFQPGLIDSVDVLNIFMSDYPVRSLGKLSLYTSKDLLEDTEFILQVANDTIHALTGYFGPSSHELDDGLSFVVRPNTSSLVETTKLGRVTHFKQKDVLYNPRKDGFETRIKAFTSVAQGSALQWLEGPISKHDSWLQRGLAALYGYYALHLAYPRERYMERFALTKDRFGVTQGSQALNMFRMMVGHEKWDEIVKDLLKQGKTKKKPVTLQDFVQELNNTAREEINFPDDIDFNEMFVPFEIRDPIPVLNVQRLYSEGKAVLSYSVENTRRWIIPYNFAYRAAHFDHIGPIHWLTEQTETISVGIPDDQWIVFNKQQFSPYRVNYDERNWRLIIEALRSNISNIHPMNRAQLLENAIFFVNNNLLDVKILLELMTYLPQESDYIALHVIRDIVALFYNIHPDVQPSVKKFFRHLTEPIYQSFNSRDSTPPKPHFDRFVELSVSSTACWAGNEQCLRQARVDFQKAASANTSVDPNWSYFVYTFGIVNASDYELQWLLDQYVQSNSTRGNFAFVALFAEVNSVHQLGKVIRTIYEKNAKTPDNCLVHFANSLMYPLVESRAGQFERLRELVVKDQDLMDLIGKSNVAQLIRAMGSLAGDEEQWETVWELAEFFDIEMKLQKSFELSDDKLFTLGSINHFIGKYFDNL